MHEERQQRLAEFAAWARQYIKGDEKGEAQIFLDRLFSAFGLKGVQEAGARCEERIKKADNGGTAFADLVWKPVVLIEMKRRGEDLRRHYRQAFDYWTRLVPGRPRYVILCNFDEFWVYDFETQMDTPVDQVCVEELPKRWGPLAFLFPNREKPTFGNDQQEVTRQAADRLATCFNKLIARKLDRTLAQRFTLQMLVAMFAQSIGLLEKYFVNQLLDDCRSPRDSFDLLGGLFTAMNTRGGTSGGRFHGVNYFNGGLFAEPARIELYPDELAQLKQAARSDWSRVRPEIFGTLFEHSTGKPERHAYGAHFTSPVDIMKIVGPTIVEPWRERIAEAKTLAGLRDLLQRMHEFRVLDPACGSGNFLYIAYREMKRLEAHVLDRISQTSKKLSAEQLAFGYFVTASNFFGMDIIPFAVELAKVTMMIARKLAIDELHITEPALPLDNLDANFRTCDALIDEAGNPTQWPKVDVIIGNPPFLGAKRLKPERGPDYVNAIRRAYPDVPGMADYCVYWFRKAHDHLPTCTTEDPVSGRAGLVGTQNVRNNQSRVGGLDHIVKTGTIVEAVDNQPWSGEANVHVSIVDWVKTHNEKVLPAKRRLWYTTDPSLPLLDGSPRKRGRMAVATPGKRRAIRKEKSYELAYRDCGYINSALSDDIDVSKKRVLECNKIPKRCYQGKIPGYRGFLIDKTTAMVLARDSASVVVPYLTGRELLSDFRITRWAIDFRDMNMIDAAASSKAFDYCKRKVLPSVQRKHEVTIEKKSDMEDARKEHLERWWQFWNRRDELNSALCNLSRYIGCSRVTRRPVMAFVSGGICPSDLIQVFAFDDDYSFGVLQAEAHFEWFRKSSRLKVETDIRYSVREVFDTFPWPQKPKVKQISAVAVAAREVRRVRDEALKRVHGGLRAVYRTLELPGKNPLKDAHAALDAAVLDAYGFSPRKDILSQLLELNLDVAARIEAGRPVTPPGVPPDYPYPDRLVTEDCVQAE